MFYSDTKVIVHLPDGDFFDIIAGVLQGDTFAPYLFIISLDCIHRMWIDLMKENGFLLKRKARRRQFPADTITDENYADDIVRIANTPTEAEFLLYSLEQAVGGIGFYVNADKMEYMCFNQEADTSILNGSTLKLMENFMFLFSWRWC